MSSPTQSAERSTTGSLSPDFARVVFILGSVPRTRTGDGSCACCSKLDQRVEKLLEDCEREDQKEEGLSSSVAMDKELAQAERLKNKVKEALEALKESGKEKINITDPDCALMHSVQGSHASYNVQSVVDEGGRLRWG